MFERYTEKARRVLFFARYEASQLGSVTIEVEHLLLGLMRESKGIIGRVFDQSGISIEDLVRDLASGARGRERVSTADSQRFDCTVILPGPDHPDVARSLARDAIQRFFGVSLERRERRVFITRSDSNP